MKSKMEERVSLLEKRVKQLEELLNRGNHTRGRSALDWKIRANIKYEEFDGLTLEEVARKYNVSVSTVRRIYSEPNAAEEEYQKVTSQMLSSINFNQFLEWRKSNI
jgi:DNA invertase Pin-like site-specific DNA recombinase